MISLGDEDAALEAALEAEYPAAAIERGGTGLDAAVEAILRRLRGERQALDLPLDVRATAFQRRVWEALSAIPYGETRSYREIAASIGVPGASRAVGRACAVNPVPLIVPCHRAVGSNGDLTGYRWGLERKAALLAGERSAISDQLSAVSRQRSAVSDQPSAMRATPVGAGFKPAPTAES